MVPMIKNRNDAINPVIWIDESEYDDYISQGYINARLFYGQMEAKYAKMRRQIEKEIVRRNVER